MTKFLWTKPRPDNYPDIEKKVVEDFELNEVPLDNFILHTIFTSDDMRGPSVVAIPLDENDDGFDILLTYHEEPEVEIHDLGEDSALFKATGMTKVHIPKEPEIPEGYGPKKWDRDDD